MSDLDDTSIWKLVESQAAEFETYLEMQRVADVITVLHDEWAQEREKPAPPRTDIPLSLTTTRK